MGLLGKGEIIGITNIGNNFLLSYYENRFIWLCAQSILFHSVLEIKIQKYIDFQ